MSVRSTAAAVTSAVSLTALALANVLQGVLPTDDVGKNIAALSQRYNITRWAPGGVKIGDGASHPVSSLIPGTFADLAAAQAFFGLKPGGAQACQAVTDEVAFCTIQKVLTFALNAGGGRVVAPNGKYLMGNRPLTTPHSVAGDDATDVVKFCGEGKRSTTLYWQTDGGVGDWAMGCYTRHTYCRVEIEDLHLVGPGTATALGVSPCNLRGIATSSNWVNRRVSVENFYCAVGIHDDHTKHEDCTYGRGCYYGVWFDGQTFGTDDLGDHNFTNTNIGFTKRAAWACSGANQIEHCLILDCHAYGNPYVFWREGGATNYSWITNTTIIKLQAESTGNAVWGCADGTANSLDRVDANTFTDIQYLQSNDYRIAGENCGAALGGVFANNTFLGPNTQFGSGGNYAAATAALFAVKVFQSNIFIGSGWFNMTNLGSTTKPLVSGDTIIFNTVVGAEQNGGEIRRSSTDVSAGNVVVEDGLNCKALSAGTLGQPILGIATVSCNAGAGLYIATKGHLDAINKVGPAIQAGDLLCVDEGGSGAVRSVRAGGPPICGIVGRAQGGAAAGVGTVGIAVEPMQAQALMPVIWNDFVQDSATAHTLAIADIGHTVEMTNAAASTFTLPPAGTGNAAFPPNAEFTVVQDTGAGQVTLALGSGVTLKPAGKLKLTADMPVTLKRRGATNVWRAYGPLSA